MGKRISEVFPELYRRIEEDRRVALEGELRSREVPFGGQWFLCQYGPIQGDEGTVVAGASSVQRLTEVIKTREYLLFTQKMVDEAQRAGRIGTWSFDCREGVLDCSLTCIELYGFNAEDPPRHLQALFPIGVAAKTEEVDARLAEARTRNSFEIVHTGPSRVFRVQARIRRGEDGRPTRWRG